MLHEVTAVSDVPEFVSVMTQSLPPTLHEVTWELTIAVTENPEGDDVVVTVRVLVIVWKFVIVLVLTDVTVFAGNDPEA